MRPTRRRPRSVSSPWSPRARWRRSCSASSRKCGPPSSSTRRRPRNCEASNEELQAINEELRSATEELETSKEELQSLNEELRTVNQELKIKVEEQTQTSNDVQNLINSTDFGTVFLDRDGRIKLFTPRARDIFNLIASDRGRPLQDINTNLVDVDLQGDIEQVLDRLERIEREVVTRAGRWQLMKLAPYRTGDDRIEGVVLTFVDITDRRLSAERLARSEERLRRALEVETVGVLFFSMEGIVSDANQAFLHLSGYAREDIEAGRVRWSQIAPPGTESPFSHALEALRLTDRSTPFEAQCRRPDGSEWSGIFSAKRLSETEGAAFVVDITERQRAAQALREADRRKNEFLATLAHELRNPLAPIATGLEVMRLCKLEDPRARRARDLMERQTANMVRLVEDLLEVTRITLGKIELRRELIDIRDILRATADTCLPVVEAERQDLKLDLPEEPLPMLADPVRLGQVFTNLLNNAVKYTPPGGHLRIGARRDGDNIVAVVADDGLGIAAQMLPHVFEMFAQGPDVPAGNAPSGLGVGLALARSLVLAHGGRVDARSEGRNRGSEFVVTLPLGGSDSGAHRQEVKHVDIVHRRVLVVDDNPDIVESMATLLGLMGAEVTVARDGSEALSRFETARPDLVLLDLGMPGLDGFEVARRLRKTAAGPTVTLVALTGWGQPHDRDAAMAAGFDHHLTKPATIERLRELLGSPLKGEQPQR